MHPRLLFTLLLATTLLLTGSKAGARTQHNLTLAERMLTCIKEPVLHAFANAVNTWNSAAAPDVVSISDGGLMNANNLAPYYAPTPEFRKYQNSHIAPTRMITGGSAIAVGIVMLVEGYKQDTKYPWSGPSVSPSPLNIFGGFIVAVGIGLMISGLLFYSQFKKHMITPYNKAW